ICSARNTKQRAFFAELNEISEASTGKMKVFWVLSQAEAYLQLGDDYHHKGRLSKPLLKTLLTRHDYDVYLCGPNEFMQDQYNSLRALGIQDAHIFAEAFGFSSLVRDGSNAVPLVSVAKEAIIRFSQSQCEQTWSPEKGTLLEFAESHGLTPEYGCRKGECGACKVKLLSGSIVYKQSMSYVLDDNEILLCCAVPAVTENETVSCLEIEL
ncbi:MAG: 2Fe-2S iron-sulfur cluster binding domain-containing protein, partial [Methylococcales bacterium]|nr:2Fe-2S iron-sulfur cluster binding domain-containing protein [Methylococcales bacterium]